ncbi:hypothetical protein EXE41_04740 [Halorubrum sp. SD690R]|uniref:hypothetical protein n=1 Tax=Halorubrum sp. SD690R TaxID=2518117 RepID=UPI0010F55142|nr:hypothetical protein [Halorubrum sp. SD690R]TKX47535.1 hypothetical protein EXE41_04740 [Halorubrum sp. SD690R]
MAGFPWCFLNSKDGIPDLTLNLVPRDTLPESDELLLQPEAKFNLKYQIADDSSYSGTLRLQAPDPLKIKNRGRPKDIEWKSDRQEISATGVQGEGIILMKVLLPSQYRGRMRGKIEIFECSNDGETRLCKHSVVSDPPLTHTTS